MLAGMLLVAMPAVAEDVAFQGHAVQVDASREARPIVRLTGVKYSIPGSALQILGKAEQCAARQADALTGVSLDADNARLVAVGRASYRKKGQRSARGRMAIDAADGSFRVAFTELATSPADDGGYVPLLQHDAAGWENALEAIIGVEQGLLDCMFR
ncbi:MAG: hypothetical protein EOO24_49560 [Comamonadaceae bacterium]|nr:MAG: hypothetical protein EOO24_49560 [Comamonadaceae bacterium]